MASDPTVVDPDIKLTKPRLHALLMEGWARAIAKHGKGGFADKLEISGEALNKQLVGSMPSFDVIDRAFDAERTVLDDYFAKKGKRIVDREAVCDTDDIGLHMSRLLAWLHEATHPESPGGERITHIEMLAGEATARELHRCLGQFLEQCGTIRRPRAA